MSWASGGNGQAFQHGHAFDGQSPAADLPITPISRHTSMASSPKAGEQLTEHEAAIYDRQLRVWGVETQKRQVYGAGGRADCHRADGCWSASPRRRCNAAAFTAACPANSFTRRLSQARVLIAGCNGLAAEVRSMRWRQHVASINRQRVACEFVPLCIVFFCSRLPSAPLAAARWPRT